LEKIEASRKGTGQAQSLEQVALSELLRDIVAVKNGVRPQTFERKETDGLRLAAECRGDARTRVGA
jgi:hypothetical protein